MKLVEIEEKEYNQFIKKIDKYNFFQSIEWAKFKSKTGWKMNVVGLFDNKKLIAATTLLSRKLPIINKKMYYAPRGFAIDYNDFKLLGEFTKQLKSYIKSNSGIFLKINPYIEYIKRDKDGNALSEGNDKLVDYLKSLGYVHYGFYKDAKDKKDLEPRWISVIDLKDKSTEQLLKEMRQTTRWMINKSRKNCISITVASYDDIEKFKKIMNHTAERREFSDRSLSYYQTMYNTLKEHGMIRIMLASINLDDLKKSMILDIEHLKDRIKNIESNFKKQNQVNEYNSQIEAIEKRLKALEEDIKLYGSSPTIAAGLYLSYGKEIVYLFGGSYKEFMGYGAQYLMQYEMIEYAKENGYDRLNFYGIDGNFSKDSENYGLFDFKRGFNSDVVELIGEFDLIISKFYYSTYNMMLKFYKYLRKIKK